MTRIQEAVESQFIDHAKALGLQPGMKKYAKLERTFFAGAVVAVNAAYPPAARGLVSDVMPAVWTDCLTSGAPVIECFPAAA